MLYHSDLYISLFSMLFVSILKRVSAHHTKFTWSDCLLADFDEGNVTG